MNIRLGDYFPRREFVHANAICHWREGPAVLIDLAAVLPFPPTSVYIPPKVSLLSHERAFALESCEESVG